MPKVKFRRTSAKENLEYFVFQKEIYQSNAVLRLEADEDGVTYLIGTNPQRLSEAIAIGGDENARSKALLKARDKNLCAAEMQLCIDVGNDIDKWKKRDVLIATGVGTVCGIIGVGTSIGVTAAVTGSVVSIAVGIGSLLGIMSGGFALFAIVPIVAIGIGYLVWKYKKEKEASAALANEPVKSFIGRDSSPTEERNRFGRELARLLATDAGNDVATVLAVMDKTATSPNRHYVLRDILLTFAGAAEEGTAGRPGHRPAVNGNQDRANALLRSILRNDALWQDQPADVVRQANPHFSNFLASKEQREKWLDELNSLIKNDPPLCVVAGGVAAAGEDQQRLVTTYARKMALLMMGGIFGKIDDFIPPPVAVGEKNQKTIQIENFGAMFGSSKGQQLLLKGFALEQPNNEVLKDALLAVWDTLVIDHGSRKDKCVIIVKALLVAASKIKSKDTRQQTILNILRQYNSFIRGKEFESNPGVDLSMNPMGGIGRWFVDNPEAIERDRRAVVNPWFGNTDHPALLSREMAEILDRYDFVHKEGVFCAFSSALQVFRKLPSPEVTIPRDQAVVQEATAYVQRVSEAVKAARDAIPLEAQEDAARREELSRALVAIQGAHGHDARINPSLVDKANAVSDITRTAIDERINDSAHQRTVRLAADTAIRMVYEAEGIAQSVAVCLPKADVLGDIFGDARQVWLANLTKANTVLRRYCGERVRDLDGFINPAAPAGQNAFFASVSDLNKALQSAHEAVAPVGEEEERRKRIMFVKAMGLSYLAHLQGLAKVANNTRRIKLYEAFGAKKIELYEFLLLEGERQPRLMGLLPELTKNRQELKDALDRMKNMVKLGGGDVAAQNAAVDNAIDALLIGLSAHDEKVAYPLVENVLQVRHEEMIAREFSKEDVASIGFARIAEVAPPIDTNVLLLADLDAVRGHNFRSNRALLQKMSNAGASPNVFLGIAKQFGQPHKQRGREVLHGYLGYIVDKDLAAGTCKKEWQQAIQQLGYVIDHMPGVERAPEEVQEVSVERDARIGRNFERWTFARAMTIQYLKTWSTKIVGIRNVGEKATAKKAFREVLGSDANRNLFEKLLPKDAQGRIFTLTSTLEEIWAEFYCGGRVARPLTPEQILGECFANMKVVLVSLVRLGREKEIPYVIRVYEQFIVNKIMMLDKDVYKHGLLLEWTGIIGSWLGLATADDVKEISTAKDRELIRVQYAKSPSIFTNIARQYSGVSVDDGRSTDFGTPAIATNILKIFLGEVVIARDQVTWPLIVLNNQIFPGNTTTQFARWVHDLRVAIETAPEQVVVAADAIPDAEPQPRQFTRVAAAMTLGKIWGKIQGVPDEHTKGVMNTAFNAVLASDDGKELVKLLTLDLRGVQLSAVFNDIYANTEGDYTKKMNACTNAAKAMLQAIDLWKNGSEKTEAMVAVINTFNHFVIKPEFEFNGDANYVWIDSLYSYQAEGNVAKACAENAPRVFMHMMGLYRGIDGYQVADPARARAKADQFLALPRFNNLDHIDTPNHFGMRRVISELEDLCRVMGIVQQADDDPGLQQFGFRLALRYVRNMVWAVTQDVPGDQNAHDAFVKRRKAVFDAFGSPEGKMLMRLLAGNRALLSGYLERLWNATEGDNLAKTAACLAAAKALVVGLSSSEGTEEEIAAVMRTYNVFVMRKRLAVVPAGIDFATLTPKAAEWVERVPSADPVGIAGRRQVAGIQNQARIRAAYAMIYPSTFGAIVSKFAGNPGMVPVIPAIPADQDGARIVLDAFLNSAHQGRKYPHLQGVAWLADDGPQRFSNEINELAAVIQNQTPGPNQNFAKSMALLYLSALAGKITSARVDEGNLAKEIFFKVLEGDDGKQLIQKLLSHLDQTGLHTDLTGIFDQLWAMKDGDHNLDNGLNVCRDVLKMLLIVLPRVGRAELISRVLEEYENYVANKIVTLMPAGTQVESSARHTTLLNRMSEVSEWLAAPGVERSLVAGHGNEILRGYLKSGFSFGGQLTAFVDSARVGAVVWDAASLTRILRNIGGKTGAGFTRWVYGLESVIKLARAPAAGNPDQRVALRAQTLQLLGKLFADVDTIAAVPPQNGNLSGADLIANFKKVLSGEGQELLRLLSSDRNLLRAALEQVWMDAAGERTAKRTACLNAVKAMLIGLSGVGFTMGWKDQGIKNVIEVYDQFVVQKGHLLNVGDNRIEATAESGLSEIRWFANVLNNHPWLDASQKSKLTAELLSGTVAGKLRGQRQVPPKDIDAGFRELYRAYAAGAADLDAQRQFRSRVFHMMKERLHNFAVPDQGNEVAKIIQAQQVQTELVSSWLKELCEKGKTTGVVAGVQPTLKPEYQPIVKNILAAYLTATGNNIPANIDSLDHASSALIRGFRLFSYSSVNRPDQVFAELSAMRAETNATPDAAARVPGLSFIDVMQLLFNGVNQQTKDKLVVKLIAGLASSMNPAFAWPVGNFDLTYDNQRRFKMIHEILCAYLRSGDLYGAVPNAAIAVDLQQFEGFYAHGTAGAPAVLHIAGNPPNPNILGIFNHLATNVYHVAERNVAGSGDGVDTIFGGIYPHIGLVYQNNVIHNGHEV